MTQTATGLLCLASAAVVAFAQPASVPDEFRAAYAELDAKLARSSLTQGWNGSKYPVLFGTEAIPVSAYTAITQPGYYARSVTPFLDALQSIGAVKILKINLHFPLLYRPFHEQWPASGGIQAYEARLTLYRRFVADAHARGIKVIVQSMVQGFGAAASTAADPLDLNGYYQSLTFRDYVAGRAEHVLFLCRTLRPDYISFESEPDYEYAKGVRPELDPANPELFVKNNLTLVTSIRDALENADPPIPGLHSQIRTIIGMGSWTRQMRALIDAYTRMSGIDVIDIHVHPINTVAGNDYLANIGTIASAAIAQGKAVGMNETTIYHEAASEVGKLGAPDVEVRQVWSFWEPLDIAFLRLMANLANYRRMEYLSFGWPNVFFSWLDYASTPGCPTPPSDVCSVSQWYTAANAALGTALTSNPVPLTGLGQEFRSVLQAQAAAPRSAAVVSAFDYSGPTLAPDSIVSIFGERLASGSPLAATAVIRDSAGRSSPLRLLLVQTSQINALIPTNIAPGPAIIDITAADGSLSTSNVFVAPLAPSLAIAGSSLPPLANGLVVSSTSAGAQRTTSTVACAGSDCSAVPVKLNAAETAVLTLFGTGFRGTRPGAVTATIAATPVPVLFSGAQPEFAGLDQINLLLPAALAGKGLSEVRLSFGDVPARPVRILLE